MADRGILQYNRIICKKVLDKNKQRHKAALREITPSIDNKKPDACNFPIASKVKKGTFFSEHASFQARALPNRSPKSIDFYSSIQKQGSPRQPKLRSVIRRKMTKGSRNTRYNTVRPERPLPSELLENQEFPMGDAEFEESEIMKVEADPVVSDALFSEKKAKKAHFEAQRSKIKTHQTSRMEPVQSLNILNRNNEMKRIMKENHCFLQRLQNRKSNFNVFDWENDRKQQMKRMKMLCLYPLSISHRQNRSQKRQRRNIPNPNTVSDVGHYFEDLQAKSYGQQKKWQQKYNQQNIAIYEQLHQNDNQGSSVPATEMEKELVDAVNDEEPEDIVAAKEEQAEAIDQQQEETFGDVMDDPLDTASQYVKVNEGNQDIQFGLTQPNFAEVERPKLLTQNTRHRRTMTQGRNLPPIYVSQRELGNIKNSLNYEEDVLSGKTKSKKSSKYGQLKRPQPMIIKNQMSGISNERKVLYRNFHQIGDQMKVIYLVEISKHNTKIFFCLFPNFEKPDIFLDVTVSEKIGLKMLSDNFGVFENLISKFKIKYGKLWIKGYHGCVPDPRKQNSSNPNTLSFYNQPTLIQQTPRISLKQSSVRIEDENNQNEPKIKKQAQQMPKIPSTESPALTSDVYPDVKHFGMESGQSAATQKTDKKTIMSIGKEEEVQIANSAKSSDKFNEYVRNETNVSEKSKDRINLGSVNLQNE